MGFLFWWAYEDDGHETMLTEIASGEAISVGVGVTLPIRFTNEVEYTVINNPSQTAEYRHRTYSDTE